MADKEQTSFAEFAVFMVGLSQKKTFGKVTIRLQEGRIVLVELEQQFKPGQLPGVNQAKAEAVADVIGS